MDSPCMLIIPAVKHICRRSQRGSLPATSCLAARPKHYSSIHFSGFPYLPCSATFQQQYSNSSGKLREHLSSAKLHQREIGTVHRDSRKEQAPFLFLGLYYC